MKKILTIVCFIWATISLNAQQDNIIFVDFEPDTALHVGGQPNPLWIDFDNDALPDLQMHWYIESPGYYVVVSSRDDNVDFCIANDNDTIPNLTDWWVSTYTAERHKKYAIRIEKDGDFFYGWFRIYPHVEGIIHDFCFDKYAFCTIPNYPLRWGQTELNEDDVVESDGNDSFTIHPNPSSGVFIVTGENLKHIDIYDVLGQKVSSLNADADHTTIDLGDQPAGIYLISVTEHNGKHHTRQIVKK